MSFKGVVTRKDKETGVDLLAKIVTENKKKSTKKTYKVRVASNGLSDTECCSRAVALKKEEVSNAGPGGAEDLTVSINLNALGAFGTTLTYRIVNDNGETPLTDYLSANGTLLGAPVFGSKDATGRLHITASKGEEAITAVVAIAIKAYTAEAIMHDELLVSKAAFWKAMTNNQEYMLANDKITFLATWEPWKSKPIKPSNQPITVSYVVTDKLTPHGITRIADNTAGVKQVLCPAYSKLLALQNAGTDFNVREYQDQNIAGNTSKSLQCDGLIVRATLTLGDATTVFEYNISTRSAVLTNEEIIQAIENLADITTPNGNKAYSKFMLYNADETGMAAELGGYFMGSATAPSAVGGAECYNIDVSTLAPGRTEFNIQCMTASYFSTYIALEALGLEEGNISITIEDPRVYAFNGIDEYCSDSALSNTIFSAKTGVTLSPGVLPVNLDLIKSTIDGDPSLTDAATAFAVSQTIKCDKYNGLPQTLQLMKWFYITNIGSLATGT